MKKTVLTVFCLLAVLFGAKAQDIDDRAQYKLNIATDLWYNSANAAGLAYSNMAAWRNVWLDYDLAKGKFTDAWGARSQSSLSLAGDMLMDIEGFKVAANLSLERNRLSKSRYNNSLYELSWDMPYFVALNSDELIGWKQSHAVIDVSAATPLMFDDMLSFGVNLKMDMKGASKNASPNCRYRGLSLEIMPSATFAIDEANIVGLSAGYKLRPSRSVVGTEEEASTVVLLKGLGNYDKRVAGGTMGIAPIEYSSGAFAIAMDYKRAGYSSDWLFELTFDKCGTSVSEDESKIGQVDKFLTGLSAKGLFGESRSRILSFSLLHNLNYWLEGANATTKANNNQLDANLDYTAYTGVDDGGSFDWMFGLGADMHLLSYKRYVPDASFKVVNVLPYAALGKNLLLTKEQSLLASLKLGYNFSAGSKYKYEGETVGNQIVGYMYDDEIDYLGSYYLRTTFSADYTYRLNTMLAPYASLGIGLLTPMSSAGSRFIMSLKVGVLF